MQVDVIREVASTYKLSKETLIVLLQPTSPFRSISEITQALDMVIK